MKKTKIWLIIALAALIVCGVLAVNAYAGRVSGTETAVVSVSEGMTLHVDTALRSGTVRFQVTNAAQTAVEDMELTHSYHYAVKAFTDEEFTVTVTRERAKAAVEIYVTDENGNRVKTEK